VLLTHCHLDTRDFYLVNEALLVRLPKNNEATMVRDYRPISFIHVLRKLLSKVLSKRLSLRINKLVHPTQSAFIKGRFIQDNFKLVQASPKALHARRQPSILLKVDIARAFDSVAWSFLIAILLHTGFPSKWLEWTSALLSCEH
jgi:hypothetical protein